MQTLQMATLPLPTDEPLRSGEHIVKAYIATSPSSGLNPGEIIRRALNYTDVRIRITHCGVYHSDKHHRDNDWGDTVYPVVPGHEIVGFVTEVGPGVTKYQVGAAVGVGNMVDSCRVCVACEKGTQQYCRNGGPSWVYGSRERMVEGKHTLKPIGDPTYGGYSGEIVVEQDFVLQLPNADHMAQFAPILCAGITGYTPIKKHKVGPGMKFAIAGLGGLGHFACMLGAALGAEVTVLTTTPWKVQDAKRLGATHALLVTDKDQLVPFKDYFDLIYSTIPVPHDEKTYIDLLQPGGGTYHVVGNMNEFTRVVGRDLVFHGKTIDSSNVGGLADTQELLNLVAKHNIYPEVELIDMAQVNEAMLAMVASKVHYRYVIDMNSK